MSTRFLTEKGITHVMYVGKQTPSRLPAVQGTHSLVETPASGDLLFRFADVCAVVAHAVNGGGTMLIISANYMSAVVAAAYRTPIHC